MSLPSALRIGARRLRWACCVAVIATLSAPSPADERASREALDADGLARAIAWLREAGYPDTGALPLVRVTIVVRGAGDGDGYEGAWHYAFLVEEDDDSFTVFDTTLRRRIWHRRLDSSPRSVGRYERVALEADLARELEVQASARATDADYHSVRVRDTFGVDHFWPRWRFRGALLARALVERGHTGLALAVWKHVARFADERGPWSAVDLLRHDAAGRELALWTARVHDREETWTERLAAFRALRRRLDLGREGEATEAILVRMAREGADAARPADAQDAAARAASLVQSLPAVRRCLSVLGGFSGLPGTEHDPHARLLGLGHAAVPALRRALDDLRLTRSVVVLDMLDGRYRRAVRLMRVRDLALVALQQIAGRPFYEVGHASDSSSWDLSKARVDAWWAAESGNPHGR